MDLHHASLRRFQRWLPTAALFAAISVIAACARHSGAVDSSSAAAPTEGRTFAQVAQGFGLEIGEERPQPAAAAFSSGGSAGEKDLAMLGVKGGDEPIARSTTLPGPDDWRIITNSLTLFRHAPFIVDLVLGLLVSIMAALVLTATPQRAVRFDPVARADQRKATVGVALIGCIAAQLVEASEQFLLGAEIALVLFGIGGLVRFRTLFGDARQTGTAIIAAILGLAAGMSEYSLVLLSLTVVFLVNWWMSSKAILCIKVKLKKHADLAQAQQALNALLQQQEFVVLRSVCSVGRREVEVFAESRKDFELNALTDTIEATIPGASVRINAS